MKNILVLGMGKVGSLVGVLLSRNFEVTALDQKKPHYDYNLPFECIEGDVTDIGFMKNLMKDYDAVVSALPYFLNNLKIALQDCQSLIHRCSTSGWS